MTRWQSVVGGRRGPFEFVVQHAGTICIVLCVAFCWVGLWPFNFQPPNNISWIASGNGVRFGVPSIVYSAGDVDFLGPDSSPGLTIELDLIPEDEPSWEIGSILSIIDGNRFRKLEIAQLESGLLLRSPLKETRARKWYREVQLEAGLKREVRRLIVITSEIRGTHVYIDGEPAVHFPAVRLDASRLRGQLVVGIDPTGHRNWAGRMFGLAAFARPLTSSDVARRYGLWRSKRFEELAREPGLTALYYFNEGSGNIVHDHSLSGCPLTIPPWYRLPRRRILVSPVEEWGFNYYHIVDAGRNILGFVPFGFFCFIYREGKVPRRGFAAAGWTVAVSACVSLGIELVQAYLPLRSSSLTDLICNVAGACIGIVSAISAVWFFERTPRPAASPSSG